MEEIEDYDKKSESYDSVFSALDFRVYDAVTWRYLEPCVPADPDAVVLDAGGGTVRWVIRIAMENANSGLPPIGFCIESLAGCKYATLLQEAQKLI